MEDIFHEAFGPRLRELRKAVGLPQEEVAAHLGLPATAISKIENGTRDITLAEAWKLAQVLHVDLATLAGAPADGMDVTLQRLVMSCTVEGRRDTIHLLRRLADMLETSLPAAPGHHDAPHEGEPLPLVIRHPASNAGPLPAPAASNGQHTPRPARSARRPGMAPGLSLSLALAFSIALIDCYLPLGVGGSIPYVALAALVSCVLPWSTTLSVAFACTGFTILGFVLSSPGAPQWIDLTNRGLVVSTLWITISLLRYYLSHERRYAM